MNWLENSDDSGNDTDTLEHESIVEWAYKRKIREHQKGLRAQYREQTARKAFDVAQQMAYVRSFKQKPEKPVESFDEAVEQRFKTHPPVKNPYDDGTAQ